MLYKLLRHWVYYMHKIRKRDKTRLLVICDNVCILLNFIRFCHLDCLSYLLELVIVDSFKRCITSAYNSQEFLKNLASTLKLLS